MEEPALSEIDVAMTSMALHLTSTQLMSLIESLDAFTLSFGNSSFLNKLLNPAMTTGVTSLVGTSAEGLQQASVLARKEAAALALARVGVSLYSKGLWFELINEVTGRDESAAAGAGAAGVVGQMEGEEGAGGSHAKKTTSGEQLTNLWLGVGLIEARFVGLTEATFKLAVLARDFRAIGDRSTEKFDSVEHLVEPWYAPLRGTLSARNPSRCTTAPGVVETSYIEPPFEFVFAADDEPPVSSPKGPGRRGGPEVLGPNDATSRLYSPPGSSTGTATDWHRTAASSRGPVHGAAAEGVDAGVPRGASPQHTPPPHSSDSQASIFSTSASTVIWGKQQHTRQRAQSSFLSSDLLRTDPFHLVRVQRDTEFRLMRQKHKLTTPYFRRKNHIFEQMDKKTWGETGCFLLHLDQKKSEMGSSSSGATPSGETASHVDLREKILASTTAGATPEIISENPFRELVLFEMNIVLNRLVFHGHPHLYWTYSDIVEFFAQPGYIPPPMTEECLDRDRKAFTKYFINLQNCCIQTPSVNYAATTLDDITLLRRDHLRGEEEVEGQQEDSFYSELGGGGSAGAADTASRGGIPPASSLHSSGVGSSSSLGERVRSPLATNSSNFALENSLDFFPPSGTGSPRGDAAIYLSPRDRPAPPAGPVMVGSATRERHLRDAREQDSPAFSMSGESSMSSSSLESLDSPERGSSSGRAGKKVARGARREARTSSSSSSVVLDPLDRRNNLNVDGGFAASSFPSGAVAPLSGSDERKSSPMTNACNTVLVVSHLEFACGMLTGTKALGFKLESGELNAYVIDRPGNLVQTQLILPPSRAPVSSVLSALGFAHLLHTRGVRFLFTKRRGAFSSSDSTNLQPGATEADDALTILDLAFDKVAVHMCADTVQCLLVVLHEALSQAPVLKEIRDNRRPGESFCRSGETSVPGSLASSKSTVSAVVVEPPSWTSTGEYGPPQSGFVGTIDLLEPVSLARPAPEAARLEFPGEVIRPEEQETMRDAMSSSEADLSSGGDLFGEDYHRVINGAAGFRNAMQSGGAPVEEDIQVPLPEQDLGPFAGAQDDYIGAPSAQHDSSLDPADRERQQALGRAELAAALLQADGGGNDYFANGFPQIPDDPADPGSSSSSRAPGIPIPPGGTPDDEVTMLYFNRDAYSAQDLHSFREDEARARREIDQIFQQAVEPPLAGRGGAPRPHDSMAPSSSSSSARSATGTDYRTVHQRGSATTWFVPPEDVMILCGEDVVSMLSPGVGMELVGTECTCLGRIINELS